MDLADQEDESGETEDAGHCHDDPLGIRLLEEDLVGGHGLGFDDEKRCRWRGHPGSRTSLKFSNFQFRLVSFYQCDKYDQRGWHILVSVFIVWANFLCLD